MVLSEMNNYLEGIYRRMFPQSLCIQPAHGKMKGHHTHLHLKVHIIINKIINSNGNHCMQNN